MWGKFSLEYRQWSIWAVGGEHRSPFFQPYAARFGVAGQN